MNLSARRTSLSFLSILSRKFFLPSNEYSRKQFESQYVHSLLVPKNKTVLALGTHGERAMVVYFQSANIYGYIENVNKHFLNGFQTARFVSSAILFVSSRNSHI